MRIALSFILLLGCSASTPPPERDMAPADAQVTPDRDPVDLGPDLGERTPPGARCDSDAACQAGNCLHGVCSSRCGRDADCPGDLICAGRGGGGRCTLKCTAADDCPAGLLCAVDGLNRGFCVAPGPREPASDCDVREDCSSWVCFGGECLAACDASACPEADACLPFYTQSVCVSAGDGLRETACRAGADCQSGVCRGGRCTEACSLQMHMDCPDDRVCETYQSLGLCERRCVTSADCGGGLCLADSGSRLCATPGVAPPGSVCDTDADCSSGRCELARCAAPCPDGQCGVGEVCVRDAVGATCRPAGPSIAGAACDRNERCASGVCAAGVCGAACPDGTCPDAQRCTQFADGAFCFAPCESAEDCSDLAFCDPSFREGPTCFWRGAADTSEPCSRHEDCQSGRCSAGRCLAACPDGRCGSGLCLDFAVGAFCSVDPRPTGAECSEDNECAEGLECTAGRCQPGCIDRCPDGGICTGGRCHPGCRDDGDCRPGRQCNAFEAAEPACFSQGELEDGESCKRSTACQSGLCDVGICRARCVDDACPEGTRCLELSTGAWCVPAGEASIGAPCDEEITCGAGLCVGRRCAEACSPERACPADVRCRALRGGDFCVVECDPTDAEGCSPAEVCRIDADLGRCALPEDGLAVGMPCPDEGDRCAPSTGGCGEAADGARCRSLCRLVDTVGCANGEMCSPLNTDGTGRYGRCLPAGMGPLMSPCALASDCESGWCAPDAIQGRCTQRCVTDAECPENGRCVDLARDPGAPFRVCAPTCTTDEDCPGLRCRRQLLGASACY